MATTKSVKFYPLIASCSLNSTALIYSAPIDMRFSDDMVIQARWSGTPIGNFFLDGSLNYGQGSQPFEASTGDWIPSTTAIFQATGSSGLTSYPPLTMLTSTLAQDLRLVSFPWYRMRYVPSSGASTGVLDVWVGAKQV